MLGVGQRPDSGIDVLPATLVVKRAPNGGGDERAAPTPADPVVERAHDLVVQAYVQTHGHKLTHSGPPTLTILANAGCADGVSAEPLPDARPAAIVIM